MTLPFGNNKRKYTCFVCAVIFEEFDEFKEHIIEEHEEGREYIVCPLDRCKSPVRDMRGHFKACHPKDSIPQNCQMRVIVWKDTGGKRSKKPTFKEGFLISSKNGDVPMHYRSSWEETVYKCLESWDEIAAYKVEPMQIPYTMKMPNGEYKQKNYFPDLLVQFVSGKIEVWEIKPKNQKGLNMNKCKWDACENLCESRGWEFKVYSESEIKELQSIVENQGY